MDGHHYLLWGHFFQPQACLGQGRGGEAAVGSQSAAPSSPSRPRRSETNAAHGRLYGPQTARRQPNPAWKIRRREAGVSPGRWRRERRGLQSTGWPAQPRQAFGVSRQPIQSSFFPFWFFGDSPGWPLSGCVAEDNLEFLIFLPPPPTYVYSWISG